MKFKMNDLECEIVELSQEKIREELEKYYQRNMSEKPEITRYLGLTLHDTCKIYLDEEMPNDKKRKVLLHELMHTYVECFITSSDNFNQEALCDISANSHDIIHKIVEDYFNRK